jgi:hypothetical protein
MSISLKSNSVIISDLQESRNEYSISYLYNYTLGDEANNSFDNSNGLDPFGNLIVETDANKNDNARRNLSHYVKIDLPQFSSEREIVKIEFAKVLGIIRITKTNLVSVVVAGEIERVKLRIKSLGDSIEDFINYEENLSIGLSDFNMQIYDSESRLDSFEKAIKAVSLNKISQPSRISSYFVNLSNIDSLSESNRGTAETIGISLIPQSQQAAFSTFEFNADSSIKSLVLKGISEPTESNIGNKQSFYSAMKARFTSVLDSINDGTITRFDSGLSLEIKGLNFEYLSSGSSSYTSDFTNIPFGFLVTRIDKGSITGDRLPKSPVKRFVISNSSVREFIDSDVVYGHLYSYEIRKLFFVSIAQPKITGGPRPQKYSFLLATSKIKSNSKEEVLTIVEDLPQPPSDLSFVNKNKALRIYWNHPTRKNNVAITKYAVFKRRSINEPFSCLGVLSFSAQESEAAKFQGTTDFKNLLKRDVSLSTTIDDLSFTLDEKSIYAVCSIDYHGKISNLSAQFEVKKISGTKEITSKNISPSGAPLSYPNFYLKENFGGFTRLSGISTGNSSLLDSTLKISGFNKAKLQLTSGLNTSGLKFGHIKEDTEKKSIYDVKNRDTISTGKIFMNVISVNDEQTQTVEIDITENNLSQAITPGLRKNLVF